MMMIERYLSRVCRRLHQEEDGFSIVEALAAITVLAVGAFAAAQAMTYGLSTSGLARQQLAARAGIEQQMEQARTLAYDNLVLSDTSALTHSTDPDNPDYWIDQTAQTYDADGSGSLAGEALIRVPGASPALQHYQNPVIQGNTTYSVYRFVTWVDSPTDGSGGSDAADGNGDGVSDANGQDLKRVTVVITWDDPLSGTARSSTQSSLFSEDKITYQQPVRNNAPSVSCPTAPTVSDKTVTFNAVASDSDGTIASVSWNFGDGTTGSGLTPTHTYSAYGTYSLVNTVVDNGGSSATNSGLSCTVAVPDPTSGNGGPDVQAFTIASGSTYTTAEIVTLQITKKSSGPTPTQMQFSNDGATWSTKQTFSTSTTWTLISGDGSKTVYVRLWDASGFYGARSSDSISLDGTAPAAPTLSITSTTIVGANKTVTLSWTTVTDTGSGIAQYKVYRWSITGSASSSTLICSTTSTTCTNTFKKTDFYNFYVLADDNAGNIGASSNTIQNT